MYKFPTLQSSPTATLFSSEISQLMYLSSWNNTTNIKAHQRQDSSEVRQKYKELKAGCQISETNPNEMNYLQHFDEMQVAGKPQVKFG